MTQSEHPSNDNAAAVVSCADSDWLQEYCRQSLERVRQRLPEIARALRDVGVVHVRVHYDGCGDGGQIEDVQYLDADGAGVEVASRLSFSETELQDVFYDLTQARHPGWENNDGAWGTFEWDLLADELGHTHNERFTDYETTEHEGL